ncbi:MAG: hypothetical protein HC927_01590 [Deltaproteobacteria bacterium]|nr:hypothetical protein [Deltaproteobacteria bacterium]
MTGAFLVHNGGACAILSQIRINFSVGKAFEQAALSRLGLLKNTTKIEGLTRSGHLGRAIPDAITDAGIYEVKNRLVVSYTRQLQIQVDYARMAGRPFHLIVSPRTQHVTRSLLDAVADTGGSVRALDPATGHFSAFVPRF